VSSETRATEYADSIAGERGKAAVARSFASLQSRVHNALALGVVLLVGGGFLAWYYHGIAETRAQAAHPAKPAAARGEMKLPPLGAAPAQRKTPPQVPLLEEGSPAATALLEGQNAEGAQSSASTLPPQPAPAAPERLRRLGSPVLVQAVVGYGAVTVDGGGASAPESRAAGSHEPDGPRAGQAPAGTAAAAPAAPASPLAAMLHPTVLPATSAGVLPDRRWLLPKGAFIDCTLETAIDSTLPGMTSCITATDVWSADGSVVLMERGTKLVGETRGGIAQGQRRLFVLWSEARTPAGVAITLASPGTDAVGRAGVTGEVDTHFAERFGAAILISLLDAGAAAIVAAQNQGGNSVVVSTQGSQDVVSEVLRQTVSIPPTISVPQGERLQVLVARDVSFDQVYALAHP